MFGNAKFRWFLLAPIVLALLVVVTSPIVSWAGELEDAQKAVRQNPDDATAHNNLGNFYRLKQQFREAIPSFKEAIRIKPDFAEAYINLGLSFENLDTYEEAINAYKEANRLKPGLFGIQAVIELNIKAGHYEEAIATFKELSPSIFKYQFSYDRLKKKIDTIPTLKKTQDLISKNPKDPLLYLNLGRIFKKLGSDRKAISSLKKALQLKADFAEAYFELGSFYWEKDFSLLNILGIEMAGKEFKPDGDKFKRVIHLFTESIRIRKDYAEPHFGLGKAYKSIKKFK